MATKSNKTKLILIGFFANVFEWYDFTIYAYLATAIGRVFFNVSDPNAL